MGESRGRCQPRSAGGGLRPCDGDSYRCGPGDRLCSRPCLRLGPRAAQRPFRCLRLFAGDWRLCPFPRDADAKGAVGAIAADRLLLVRRSALVRPSLVHRLAHSLRLFPSLSALLFCASPPRLKANRGALNRFQAEGGERHRKRPGAEEAAEKGPRRRGLRRRAPHGGEVGVPSRPAAPPAQRRHRRCDPRPAPPLPRSPPPPQQRRSPAPVPPRAPSARNS